MEEATSELGLGGWIRLQKLMRGGKGMTRARNSMSKQREARKQGMLRYTSGLASGVSFMGGDRGRGD